MHVPKNSEDVFAEVLENANSRNMQMGDSPIVHSMPIALTYWPH